MRATAGVCAAIWAITGCGGTVVEQVGGSTTTSTTTKPGTTTGTFTGTTTFTTTTSTATCDPNLEDIAKWQVAGSTPQKYAMGSDPTTSCNGDASVSLISDTASAPGDFGTLALITSAKPWQGKRLRLRGSLKSDSVTGWGGMWMRVDGPTSQQVQHFDNMMNRAIVGTTDWTQYDVVLDVDPNSLDVAYGVLLANEGTLWLDGVSLEVVDTSVPTTGS